MLVSDDRVAQFVAAQVGGVFEQPYTCLGIEQDGKIVVGIVFNCWTGTDIEITAASVSGYLPRRLLRRAADYVFRELGCIRLSFTTENPAVIEMVKRLNAQLEGRKRHLFGPGRDGVILGILREEWKIT
jgi:hypothetical protein